MKEKITSQINQIVLAGKKYALYVLFATLFVVFCYLTFLTLYIKEDPKIKTEGTKRVQAIGNIQFDKKTLDRLIETPEPITIEGRGGKNPFLPF